MGDDKRKVPAEKDGFIRREERNFVAIAAGTLEVPAELKTLVG